MEVEIRFYKNAKQEWYADIPEWTGNISELQMVEGADEWLDLIAKSSEECKLLLANNYIENAAILDLIYIREENLGGGGNYVLQVFEDSHINHKLWLCGVTEFVFKEIPEKIFFKQLS